MAFFPGRRNERERILTSVNVPALCFALMLVVVMAIAFVLVLFA